jgi:hypothetical protein
MTTFWEKRIRSKPEKQNKPEKPELHEGIKLEKGLDFTERVLIA